jgi:hypothetical protein
VTSKKLVFRLSLLGLIVFIFVGCPAEGGYLDPEIQTIFPKVIGNTMRVVTDPLDADVLGEFKTAKEVAGPIREKYYFYVDSTSDLIEDALKKGAAPVSWFQFFEPDAHVDWNEIGKEEGSSPERWRVRADVSLECSSLDGKTGTPENAFLLMHGDGNRIYEVLATGFMGNYHGGKIEDPQLEMLKSLTFFATAPGLYEVRIAVNKVYVDAEDDTVLRELDAAIARFYVYEDED